MFNKRLLISFVFILTLLTNTLHAFESHHSSSECSICVIADHLSDDILIDVLTTISISSPFQIIKTNPNSFFYTKSTFSLSRAPPSVS